MATVTSRICDLDPKHKDAEPQVYGAGGEFFSADLCAEDAAKLAAAIEPFVKVGVPISARDALRGVNGGAVDPAIVRAWAQRSGKYQLGDRGRIPADVVKAWREETGPKTPAA